MKKLLYTILILTACIVSAADYYPLMYDADSTTTVYSTSGGASNIPSGAFSASETDPIASALLPSYMPLAGGTFTGAVYTTKDMIDSPPASKEFATAEWVRSLSLGGTEWYFTTNVTSGFGEKTANFVALDSVAPTNIFTNIITAPLTDDTYYAGGITTQLYSELRSPISFVMYLSVDTGGSVPVKPEIYYVYEGSTNQLGDYDVGYQTVTENTPTLYTFVVPFVQPTITGDVHVVAYLKTGTIGSPNTKDLYIYGGTPYASHVDVEGAPCGETAAEVQANLDVHTGLTGTNVHGLGTMSTETATDYYAVAGDTLEGTMDTGNNWISGDGDAEGIQIDDAGGIDFGNPNVTFVPVGSSLSTYVSAASSGDTLILGAGSYSVGSGISVGKNLTIIGQGRETTTVTGTGQYTFQAEANYTLALRSLKCENTNTGDSRVLVGLNYSFLKCENVDLLKDTRGSAITSTQFGIYTVYHGAVDLRNCNIDVHTSGGQVAYGVVNYTDINGDARESTNYLYDCNIIVTDTNTASASTAILRAYNAYDNGSSNAINVYAYNSTFIARAAGTNQCWGVEVGVGTATVAAKGTFYNCYAEAISDQGLQWDYAGYGGDMTLYGCTAYDMTKAQLGNGTTYMNGVQAAERMQLQSRDSHPSSWSEGGQIYCVSNEVYVMDASGTPTVISPHPDWAGGKGIIMIEANIYEDELTYVTKEDLVAVMTGTKQPNPSLLKRISTPANMRRNWAKDHPTPPPVPQRPEISIPPQADPPPFRDEEEE